jgi:carboxylesterase
MFDRFRRPAVAEDELQFSSLNLFTEPEHQPFLFEGGKPAALLVHGFGGTPAEMRPIAGALLETGWTVQGLLLPGFGPDMVNLGERRYVEWLESITESATALREAGHGPLLLVGYSLGATLSIVAGAALQPQPDGLALLAPYWWQDRPWSRLLSAVLRPFQSREMRPFRRADLSDPRLRQSLAKFLPGADLDNPDTQRALRNFRAPVSLIEQVLGASRLGYARAGAVECPVLVVQGARDDVVRAPLTRELVDRFAGPAEYLEVDCGHELMTQPANPVWPAVIHAILHFAEVIRDR